MTPSLEPRQDPFWSYEDLALFIGAVLPCLAAALVLTRPVHFPNDGVRTVVFQSLFYGLLMGALSLLITKRYGQRFWRSLGWNFTFPGVWLLVGPPLALAL